MADDYDLPKGELMRGKKGLVMGVANHNSIAWGIASQLAAQGAEMAFTYQGESLERRVRPLAESIGVKTLIAADVADDASMDAAFEAIEKQFGTLDFVVHSVAFADLPIARQRIDKPVDVVMSNSFGFGGTNGCLVMARPS